MRAVILFTESLFLNLQQLVANDLNDDDANQQQVSSNTITLHHDPKNWTKPRDFIPERWIESLRDPSWKHDIRAFIPFNGGTFSCIGKPFGLLELRMYVATTIKRFDLVMEPDFDHGKFMGDVRSYMTTVKGALPITIHVRKL